MQPVIIIFQFDVASHTVVRACGRARLKADWLTTTTALLAPLNTIRGRFCVRSLLDDDKTRVLFRS